MSPHPTAEGRGGHFVQSLERGLAVICAFSAEAPAQSLSEVAARTGLTRAAARRFLLTLVDLGYARSDGRLFSLTPRVLELGYAYLASVPLTQVVGPHMRDLVAEIQESCSVSILDRDDVVYIARVPASRIMTVAIDVGTRFPAHLTSMGRVLLAALDEPDLDDYFRRADFAGPESNGRIDPKELLVQLGKVRRQGWSIVDQELEQGLRSIALPIRDGTGRVVAAANISAHATTRSLRRIREELLPALRQTVGQIEDDLRVASTRTPAII